MLRYASVVWGIVLVLVTALALVGCGSASTAASPSPSADPFAGTWRMDSGDHVTFVISTADDEYTVVQGSPGSSTYTPLGVLARNGDSLSGPATVTETDGQLTLTLSGNGSKLALGFDAANMTSPFETTLTKVSGSTATPVP